jgi:hypothetical protein
MFIQNRQRKTLARRSPDVSGDDIGDEYVYILRYAYLFVHLHVLLTRVDEEDDDES